MQVKTGLHIYTRNSHTWVLKTPVVEVWMTLCGSWLQSAIVLGMKLYLYASVDVLTRENLFG